MIKIDKKKAKQLEIQHKEWYRDSIHSKIDEAIEEITEKFPVNTFKDKYLEFLESLKKEGENLAILDNEKMIEYIVKYNKIGVSYKKINEIKNEILKKSEKEWELLIEEENKNMIKWKLKKIENKKKNSRIVIETDEYTKKINEIFNYEAFAEEKVRKWSRHKLMTSLDIEVCPYCQRNYITSYRRNERDNIKEKNRTTADLDHFYSQKMYPFLSLSLYNFIPSCQICNSRMKGAQQTYDKKLKVIYPYGGKQFTGIFKANENILLNLIGKEKEFEVNIEELDDESKGTVEMFNLDEIYRKAHNEYIKNMLENIVNRPSSYLESIAIIFGKNCNENNEILEKMKNNLQEIVLEPYKFKIENEEPLAKLTKDILEQFKIL